MTRKKADAKKPADTKPEEDKPAEQEGSAPKAAGAVVQGASANAAEDASEKPDGAPRAADGADGATKGDAAPEPDADGKAQEAREGAEMGAPGEGSAGGGTEAVAASPAERPGEQPAAHDGGDGGDDAAGDEPHVSDTDDGPAGKDVSDQGENAKRADEEDVSGSAGEYRLATWSTPIDDSNRMLALVADDAAGVAYYGMMRVYLAFGILDPDSVTKGPKHAGPEHQMLELKALVDKIGERATPEVCWTHLKLAGVLSGTEQPEWDRIACKVFVSVYLELKKAADQQRARIAAENAPAPPKKKIDPDDLTTGTVEGFGATIKTR